MSMHNFLSVSLAAQLKAEKCSLVRTLLEFLASFQRVNNIHIYSFVSVFNFVLLD